MEFGNLFMKNGLIFYIVMGFFEVNCLKDSLKKNKGILVINNMIV